MTTKFLYKVSDVKRLVKICLFIIISLAIYLFSSQTHANSIEFDDVVLAGFPGITGYINHAHFNYGGNDFYGTFFLLPPGDSSDTITLGAQTKTCAKGIKGLYYNNQRGYRFWPLDKGSLDILKTLDTGYNNLTMSGGWYTLCSGSNPDEIYGQITHNRYTGTMFNMIAGVVYDFTNNTYTGGLSGTFKFFNNTTGYFRDQRGGVSSFWGTGVPILSQTGTCTGIVTSGIYYNGTTAYSVVQTRNGSIWNPTTSGTHAAAPTSGSCDFKCITGYTRSGGSCQPIAANCGNGTLNIGEQCDDNNTNNGDGCNSNCELETPTCTLTNDSPKYTGEYVTFTGNTNSRAKINNIQFGDGSGAGINGTYSTYTTIHSYINSGSYTGSIMVTSTITGTLVKTGSCTIPVTILGATGAVCGNNILEGTEQCDDNNLTNGDGCNSNCALETPTCNITVNTNSGYTPLSVTFSGNKSSGANYTLNFGNGSTILSFSLPFTYIYTTSGNFTYSFTGVNQYSGGFTCIKTGNIVVNQATGTYCGDGIVQTPNSGGVMEQCDYNNPTHSGSCNLNCTRIEPDCNLFSYQPLLTGTTGTGFHPTVGTQTGIAQTFNISKGTSLLTRTKPASIPNRFTFSTSGVYTVSFTGSNPFSGALNCVKTGTITINDITIAPSIIWNNDYFIDQSFWNLSPNSTDIVNALYGSGTNDTTAYTINRSGNSCNPTSISVQYITGGLDTIPQQLSANTIYVLNSGNYRISYTNGIWMDNCSVIIGSGNVIVHSNNQITGFNAMISSTSKQNDIIDNIEIDGTNNGNGGTHIGNEKGIYFNTSPSNTINNSEVYNNNGIGISLYTYSIVNNSKSHNNGSVGVGVYLNKNNIIRTSEIYNNDEIGILAESNNIINSSIIHDNLNLGIEIRGSGNIIKRSQIYNSWIGVDIISGSNDNTIHNILSYNNKVHGILLRENTINNAINNSQTYNNGMYGIYLALNSTNNFINNSQTYNNKLNGIYLTSGSNNNKINNIQAYNNGNNGIDVTESSNNQYYGSIKLFGNTTNNTSRSGLTAGTGIYYGSLGWTSGSINTGGSMDCSRTTNPVTLGLIYMFNSSLCDTKDTLSTRSGYVSNNIRYGSNILTQIQPVRRSGSNITLYGTNLVDYNNGKYIGRQSPYLSIGGTFNINNNTGITTSNIVTLYNSISGANQIRSSNDLNTRSSRNGYSSTSSRTLNNSTTGLKNVYVDYSGIDGIFMVMDTIVYSPLPSGPVCGNNIIEGTEQCDDNNTNNGDGCSSACTLEIPTCSISASPNSGYAPLSIIFSGTKQSRSNYTLNFGNGSSTGSFNLPLTYIYSSTGIFTYTLTGVNPLSGAFTCIQTGTIIVNQATGTYCGDGIIQTPNSGGIIEQCDDSNTNNGDGCSSSCILETPTCTLTNDSPKYTGQNVTFIGNSSSRSRITEIAFGNGNGASITSNSSSYTATYSYLNSGLYTAALIATSNITGTIVKTGTCTIPVTILGATGAICGNNIIEGTEQCDNRNTISGDGCSSSCTLENPTCNISASPNSGYSPLSVTFAGTKNSRANYTLNFGNSSSTGSFSLPLTNIYSSTGVFTYSIIGTSTLSGAYTCIQTGSITSLYSGVVCRSGWTNINGICTLIGTGNTTITGTINSGTTFYIPGNITIYSSGNNTGGYLQISGINSVGISYGNRNGILIPPTILTAGSCTAPTNTLANISSGLNNPVVILEFQAGASGSTITSNQAGGYFTIKVKVNSGTIGNTYRIFRSADCSTGREKVYIDETCVLDSNKMCEFKTNKLSYFNIVSNSGLGGGGTPVIVGTIPRLRNAQIDKSYISDPFTIANFNDITLATVTKGMLYINGVAIGTSGYVQNGDELNIELYSSKKYDTTISSKITIGSVSSTFYITTIVEGDDNSTDLSSLQKIRMMSIFNLLLDVYSDNPAKEQEFLYTLRSMLTDKLDGLDVTDDSYSTFEYFLSLIEARLLVSGIDESTHIAPTCKEYQISFDEGERAYFSPDFKKVQYFSSRQSLTRYIDSKNPGDCRINTYGSDYIDTTNKNSDKHTAPNGKVYNIENNDAGYTSPDLSNTKYFDSLQGLRAYLNINNPAIAIRNHAIDTSFNAINYTTTNGKVYKIYKTDKGYMSYKLIKVRYFSTLDSIKTFINNNNKI